MLERLSAELCDEVTGRDDSGEMLEEADRRNLFLVALDDRRHWFRYHQLLADALQEELHRGDPDAEVELHRRASGWFERKGSAPEAVRHAIAAWLATVSAWLDAVGEEGVRADPWLAAARLREEAEPF